MWISILSYNHNAYKIFSSKKRCILDSLEWFSRKISSRNKTASDIKKKKILKNCFLLNHNIFFPNHFILSTINLCVFVIIINFCWLCLSAWKFYQVPWQLSKSVSKREKIQRGIGRKKYIISVSEIEFQKSQSSETVNET